MPPTARDLPSGAPLRWSSPGVLYARVLHPGAPERGPPPALASDPLPAWTLAPPPVPDAEPFDDVHRRLCAWLSGVSPDATVRWTGSMTLCARVLSVLDALVVSATLPLPAPHAWQRCVARVSPAPGGAVDALLTLSWHVLHAWAARVAAAHAVPVVPDPATVRESVDRVRLSALAIAPIPPWSLGLWSGDPRDPPRVRQRVVNVLPGLTEARAGVRLADASAALRAPLLPIVRERDRGGSSASDPRTARALSRTGRALRAYQSVASRAVRLLCSGYRLAGCVRFRLDRLAERAADLPRPGADARRLASQLDALLGACAALSATDRFALRGLFHDARALCALDPAWLVASEVWLAGLWEARAREALAHAWGVDSRTSDHPERVGRAPVSGGA